MEICKDCGKHIHHSDDDCWYCNVCSAPLCDECVRTPEEPAVEKVLLSTGETLSYEWYDYCKEHLPTLDELYESGEIDDGYYAHTDTRPA